MPRISWSILFCLVACCLIGCGAGNFNAKGVVGPVGPAGLTFRNAYDPAARYVATDVVTYQGSAFVALAEFSNVTPLGAPASATNWAVLAQGGKDGMTGATGATGSAGIAGPQGVPGPQGVGGSRGLEGETGPIGLTGAQGAIGPAGIQGLVGPGGAKGATGSTGAQGLPGPAGATPSTAVASYLSGRNYALLGDSLITYGVWQPVVNSRTGMNLVQQDARGGRAFADAFECYGNPPVGGVLGVWNGSALNRLGGPCRESNAQATEGYTLAQNMASADVFVILLGSNDALGAVPVGQIGDATNAGTFYGNMRWVVEAYRKAKPTMRIVMVSLGYISVFDNNVTGRYRDATVAYGKSVGIPVLDMLGLGGVGVDNYTSLYLDYIHHTRFYDANYFGPRSRNT